MIPSSHPSENHWSDFQTDYHLWGYLSILLGKNWFENLGSLQEQPNTDWNTIDCSVKLFKKFPQIPDLSKVLNVIMCFQCWNPNFKVKIFLIVPNSWSFKALGVMWFQCWNTNFRVILFFPIPEQLCITCALDVGTTISGSNSWSFRDSLCSHVATPIFYHIHDFPKKLVSVQVVV